MKKILISKFHERSPSPPKLLYTNENPNKSKERVNFQPPLPIGPPPQDLPPIIEIKKEVMDEGYQSLSSDSSPEFDAPVLDENIRIKNEEPPEPSDQRSMCRRFARGTCTKGSYCRFKHEIVLSELKGLYRFCWDYQNKTCERAFCQHVHATIFEEQKFYRTGYLPPKATAHLQENQDLSVDNNIPEQRENFPPEFKFSKPQLQNGSSPPQFQSMAPPTFRFNYPKNEMSPEFKADLKPVKRTWSPNQELCSGVPEFLAEPLSKKCKGCDVTLFRVQMNSNRMAETMRSMVRLKAKTEELDAKATRLKYITEGLIALGNVKSFEDFINRVVSGDLEVTAEKATKITEAVQVVLALEKSLKP